MAKELRPDTATQAVPSQAAFDRIHVCRTWLYLYGFLSEAENKKVQGRIRKWVDRANQQAAKAGEG